jgi:glutathione S-transferase
MINYISVAEAVEMPGLRVVFSPGFPGPWSVAARIILELKNIDFIPVAQAIGEEDKVLRAWTGQESAPAAVLNKERGRSRWDEILLLAERLAPTPSLIPADEDQRATMFGLANAICGEDGFGWNFRLYKMVAWEDSLAGRSSEPMFLTPEQVAIMQFRYGDPSSSAEKAKARMAAIFRMLANRLHANRKNGSPFLVGDSLTAADIYWTTFSTLVAPIRDEFCPMPAPYREMGEAMGADLGSAVDPILIEHREHVLVNHCPLPLKF